MKNFFGNLNAKSFVAFIITDALGFWAFMSKTPKADSTGIWGLFIFLAAVQVIVTGRSVLSDMGIFKPQPPSAP
jgi:hypothetical protein